MTVTALSPLAVTMLTAESATATAAAPATPTVATRRSHNPYLRAPVPAAAAAFVGSLSCTAAPSPSLGPAAASVMMPSPMGSQYSQFPAVVKPQQQQMTLVVPATTIAKAAAPVPHPMRPQPHFPPQQQQNVPAAAMMMPSSHVPSSAATSCLCAPAAEMMGYPQSSGMSMMGSTMMMPAAPSQNLQAYVPQQQQQQQHAPVGVISHKDLSGSALRYVRFTPLDTTSAAAPRRDRASGPFQAPVMPPVINEALMASPDAATLVDVFVSQLPFDLPLQALRALADAVVPGAPIRIAHAAPHQRRNGAYDGCCFVKMPEADAHRFIAALHKRVLFDVFGLWVADCAEGLEEMTAYCAHMQGMRPEARRRVLCRPTPFSAVTAELAKRVYAF